MFDALLILISLYLPGHFLGRSMVRKGDGWTEMLLIRIAAGAALATPILIMLALFGWFTVPVIAVSLAVCAAGAFWTGRGPGHVARFSRWDLAALGLFAGGLALYARPAEYIINSRDPGVYTVVADRLARTGEFLKWDPLVAAVSSFHPFLEGKKYPAFFIDGEGLIVPQFFPGPFAWLGVGNLAGGLWGSLYVVPVFGALAIVAAFVLGSELFGRWAGLLGAALLAASYTQVWWARHPSSEVMAQFFVLAGLWLAVRFVKGTGPASGVLAGLLIGGAMLVRVDGFLAAAAIPLLIGYDLLTGRPVRRWLLPGVPLVLSAVGALLCLNTVGGRYLYILYSEHGLDRALDVSPYALAAVLAVAAVLWTVRREWGTRLGSWLEVRGGEVALVAAVGAAGLALWAYFVLPVPWESLPVASRDYDVYGTQVLVRMVWFVTPAVALLALAGLLLAAYRFDAPKVLLLGAVLSFGVLYTAIPNVAPDLPWATRRFVPAVFPGVSLLAGYAVVEAGRALGFIRGRRAGAFLSVSLAAVALVWTAYTMLPILGFREYEGAIAAFERVEAEIPEAEVVYVERPDGYDGSVSTFEYVYDHPALPYDRARFRNEVGELTEAGLLDDAVYITTDGGPAPLISGVEFHEVAREDVTLPRLDFVEGHEQRVPEKVERLRLAFRIYRVEVEER